MFRRIQQDLLIPKPQFTWAQSGTQQPPPTHKKMGENKKIRSTDDFQICCSVFICTNRYRNDYKNPSSLKNNYTVAEIRCVGLFSCSCRNLAATIIIIQTLRLFFPVGKSRLLWYPVVIYYQKKFGFAFQIKSWLLLFWRAFLRSYIPLAFDKIWSRNIKMIRSFVFLVCNRLVKFVYRSCYIPPNF